MTQALAAFDDHGVVLATDGRATRIDAAGRQEYFTLEKLFPLGHYGAVLSGGAGVSVSLSLALCRAVERRRGLQDLGDIVEFALDFLSRGYERHLEEHGPEPEGLRRIYFILAGFSPEKPPPGYSLHLLASEEDVLPLRPIPVGQLVVMPRNMGLEMRLSQTLARNAPLEEILELSRDFLRKMANLQEEVGPPFYFATITPEGYRRAAIYNPRGEI
jgi:20S proteasome alpha/beta subunit